MKIHFILVASVALFAVACGNKSKEVDETETSSKTEMITEKENFVSTEKQTVSEKRDVMYYYEKYADVDSEDPSIGVGPRIIVSKDLEKGIVKYKFKQAFNGENPIQTLQLWHMDGFDYIDYPGGYILIEGDNEYPIFTEEEPMKLAMKVIDNRTARGGECDYAASPEIKIRNNKICVVLTCSDDPNFSETIGTITLKNGKLKVLEN
jgi:hypothetical protein